MVLFSWVQQMDHDINNHYNQYHIHYLALFYDVSVAESHIQLIVKKIKIKITFQAWFPLI